MHSRVARCIRAFHGPATDTDNHTRSGRVAAGPRIVSRIVVTEVIGSTSTAARRSVVRGNRRFFDATFALPAPIARKVNGAVGMIHEHGPRHPALQTRRVQRNPDGRFHFMDVDDKYRIVAVLEGDVVFLENVGNHDAVERWGENATLRQYEERLDVPPVGIRREPLPVRVRASSAPALIEEPYSLPEIVERETQLSDLLAGDVFGTLTGYIDGTIEDWMIFLSPLQRRAADRDDLGPARVTGGPGTGKSVVGLHRAKRYAKRYAKRSDARAKVLMTSFVNTVPDVLAGLFERLAPDLTERAAFRSIHWLATAVLEDRGRVVRVDEDSAHRRFDQRLASHAVRREALRAAGFTGAYLWQEITRVIQGRLVPDLAHYLALSRHGRQMPMREGERRLVWSLYEEYRESCASADPVVVDWSGHLAVACEALTAQPAVELYDAIVVDEAQDVTEAGVRLLVGLLRGGAAGDLLLIGDNGQRIYAGGWRAGHIGLEVRGRSVVLDECYRSTDEIMAAAAALGRYLSTEDFGEDGLRSTAMRTMRHGRRPRLHESPGRDAERDWMVSELAGSEIEPESCAVLLPTNQLADSWRAVLSERGFAVCDLLKYAGRSAPGVKVGTYNRGKGLEFKRVLLPSLDSTALGMGVNVDDLLRRGTGLYVAMTRARDELTMSFAGSLSPLLESVLERVDFV